MKWTRLNAAPLQRLRQELAEATQEAELADVGDLTAAPAGDDE